VVRLREPQTCDARLNIYTDANLQQGYTSEPFGEQTLIAIDLATATYTSGTGKGQPLDTKRVRTISFSGSGSGYMILTDIYLTNNDDFSPHTAAITHATNSRPTATDAIFTLSGQRVAKASAKAGIYIVDGRKLLIK